MEHQPSQLYGSEECTAYLRYIIDEFDDLPDVNHFLQSYAFLLRPGNQQGQGDGSHTLFHIGGYDKT